ncbi:MAG TPA: hypothetical protein VFI31_11400 [Pirellulales bacterium]|nr:hypothetical protein [Pirellulales bacterium]
MSEEERPYLANYVRMLFELHRLVEAGKGETSEADGLRDQMDLPWTRMTSPEIRLVDSLAADLYLLDTDEAAHELTQSRALMDLHLLELAGVDESAEGERLRGVLERNWLKSDDQTRDLMGNLSADLRLIGTKQPQLNEVSEKVGHAVKAAVCDAQWIETLSILRKHENEVSSAELAALRGICWANLGYGDIAAVFFGYAFQQLPENVALVRLYLRSLIQLGDVAEAKHHASFLAHSAANPFVRLLAADLLLECASEAGATPSTEDLRQVIEYVDRVSADTVMKETDPLLRAVASAAYLSAAFSNEAINDHAAAEQARRKAAVLNHNVEAEPNRSGMNLVTALRRQRDAMDSNLLATFPALACH